MNEFFELILNIGVLHYLVLSLFVFIIGLCGVLISRNLLRIVMSLFIMTIAVVINFLAFGCYCDNSLDNANVLGIFILLIAVIQTVIALVILFKIYQSNEYLDSEKTKDKEI